MFSRAKMYQIILFLFYFLLKSHALVGTDIGNPEDIDAELIDYYNPKTFVIPENSYLRTNGNGDLGTNVNGNIRTNGNGSPGNNGNGSPGTNGNGYLRTNRIGNMTWTEFFATRATLGPLPEGEEEYQEVDPYDYNKPDPDDPGYYPQQNNDYNFEQGAQRSKLSDTAGNPNPDTGNMNSLRKGLPNIKSVVANSPEYYDSQMDGQENPKPFFKEQKEQNNLNLEMYPQSQTKKSEGMFEMEGLRPPPEYRSQNYPEAYDEPYGKNIGVKRQPYTYPGQVKGYDQNTQQIPGIQSQGPGQSIQGPEIPRNFKNRPGNFDNIPEYFGNGPDNIENNPGYFENKPVVPINMKNRPSNFENRLELAGMNDNSPGYLINNPVNYENRPENFENDPNFLENRPGIPEKFENNPEYIESIVRNFKNRFIPFKGIPGTFVKSPENFDNSLNLPGNVDSRPGLPGNINNRLEMPGNADIIHVNYENGPGIPKKNENRISQNQDQANMQNQYQGLEIKNDPNIQDVQRQIPEMQNNSNLENVQNQNEATKIQNPRLQGDQNQIQVSQTHDPKAQKDQYQNQIPGIQNDANLQEDHDQNQISQTQNVPNLQVDQDENLIQQTLSDPINIQEKQYQEPEIQNSILQRDQIQNPAKQNNLNLQKDQNQIQKTETQHDPNLKEDQHKNQIPQTQSEPPQENQNQNRIPQTQNDTKLQKDQVQNQIQQKKNYPILQENQHKNLVLKTQNVPNLQKDQIQKHIPQTQNDTIVQENQNQNEKLTIQNDHNLQKDQNQKHTPKTQNDFIDQVNQNQTNKPTVQNDPNLQEDQNKNQGSAVQNNNTKPQKLEEGSEHVEVGSIDYHLIPGWDELSFHTWPGLTTLAGTNTTSQLNGTTGTLMAGESLTPLVPLPSQHPIVTEVKQQMSQYSQGYFTGFCTKLFEIIQQKKPMQALELFMALKTVTDKLTADGVFEDMGQPVVKALNYGMAVLVKWGPEQIQSMMPIAIAMIYGKEVALAKDVLVVINIVDAAYTLEEGDALLQALGDFQDFPHSSKKSSMNVSTNIVNALFQPFWRTAGTPQREQLLALLNKLLINKYNFQARRQGGDFKYTTLLYKKEDSNIGDNYYIFDDKDEGNTENGKKFNVFDEKTKLNIHDYENLSNYDILNNNRKKDREKEMDEDFFDKRQRQKTRYRIEKAKLLAESKNNNAVIDKSNITLAKNRQRQTYNYEKLSDRKVPGRNANKNEDSTMFSEEIHFKLIQLKAKGLSIETDIDYTFEKLPLGSSDLKRKTKKRILNHLKYKHPYQFRLYRKRHFKKKHLNRDPKGTTRKSRKKLRQYERLKQNGYNYEKTLKNRYLMDNKYDAVNQTNIKKVKFDTRRTVTIKQVPKKEIALTTKKFKKRFNIVTSASSAADNQNTTQYQKKYRKEKNVKELKIQQQAQVTYETKDKSQYLAPIMRQRNDYRNAKSTKKKKKIDTKINSIKKIREESSYSDDEKELKFVLSDAMRHESIVCKFFRNNEPKTDREDELASYTDEDSVIKTNISKVFGYDPDRSTSN